MASVSLNSTIKMYVDATVRWTPCAAWQDTDAILLYVTPRSNAAASNDWCQHCGPVASECQGPMTATLCDRTLMLSNGFKSPHISRPLWNAQSGLCWARDVGSSVWTSGCCCTCCAAGWSTAMAWVAGGSEPWLRRALERSTTRGPGAAAAGTRKHAHSRGQADGVHLAKADGWLADMTSRLADQSHFD
jgi:hypothetical protein